MYTQIVFLWEILFGILSFLIVVTCHEGVRGLVSAALGDKRQKKLSLNPLHYVEPIGAILFIITSLLGLGAFGWGREVETSALYYKNRKRDALVVAIAPSVANLILAIVAAAIYKILPIESLPLAIFLQTLVIYNVSFVICQCIPVPPMDCVKVLAQALPANHYFKYMQYEKIIQAIFLFLLILNVFGFLLNGIRDIVLRGIDLLLIFL